jgi:hypothetical protein
MSNAARWGQEIRLDGDIGFTGESAITGLADGRFVATWNVDPENGFHSEVHGQIFNADGSRRGAEFTVYPNAADHQQHPTVAALANGGFAVMWEDWTGNSPHLLVQVFDGDGIASGVRHAVSSTPTHWEYRAALAARPDGGFVAAWQTYDNSGGDQDAKARVFDANGSPSGAGFQANSQDRGYDPGVAVLTSGRVVAAWESLGVDHGRIFNADGGTASAEFAINGAAGGGRGVILTALANGGFAAVWQEAENSEDFDVCVQMFDANGNKSGTKVLVNTTVAASQFDPAIAQLADGRLVIAWADNNINGENGGDLSNIRAQVLNLDGSPSGGALLVNESALGYGKKPAIATFADGRFVVSWEDRTPTDGAGFGQKAQIFDPREGPVNLNGTALNDDWIGTPFNDTMKGGAGNDRLDGGGGDDTVAFSGSRDQYVITDLVDWFTVSGPDGTDTLIDIEYVKFGLGAPEPLTATPPAPEPIPAPPIDYVSGLFDTRYYLTHNADVFGARVSALDHFNMFGWHEGRDPNAFFDTAGYLGANPQVRAAGINPMEHYHQTGWLEGRDPSASFDTTLYLIHNPDVAAAGVDPLEHYLQHGMAEGRAIYAAVGRDIAGGFDAEYYMFHNPDVAAAGVDALEHYNTFGWHEGRDPNAVFDTAGYLAHYADVAAAGVNPLEHYMTFGWKEGRDPAAGFDTLGYLAANADVAAAGVNPLDHYLQFGIYEGRAVVDDGLWH